MLENEEKQNEEKWGSGGKNRLFKEINRTKREPTFR
jgi:hypothetical protein